MDYKNNSEAVQHIKNQIIKLFAHNPFMPFNSKQVSARIGVYDKAGRQEVFALLTEMVNDKVLLREGRTKFKLNPQYVDDTLTPQNTVVGTIDMKQSGKAYLIAQDHDGDDITIAANNTAHALHGDLVKVKLFPQRKFHKPEGRVVEILKRAKTHFVGRIKMQDKFTFLLPDNKHMTCDIFIPASELNGAHDGEKVIVEITAWPDNMSNPVGTVTKRLGMPGNNNVEMQSILADYDYPLEFSKEAEQEAARMKAPTPAEIAGRKDFRNTTTFTIDPADAKDFDDALSLQVLPNGNFEVGVHIADVSHYVRPNTSLDHEAYQRGTSVYLVDRTIPMLPEALSNGLCSLRPNEDKLCFSAVFEMTPTAKVVSQWFGKTIINSNRRFAYEEVQTIIDGGKGELCEEINTLNSLARIMRKERYHNGAIDFDSQEVKFKLDDNGKPIGVYIKETTEANWLIEEFMLLANRCVAEYVGKINSKKSNRGKASAPTFVYRVHDEPNPDKLNTFVEFVGKLGYKMKVNSRKNLADSYNKLFKDIAGKGEEYMIDSIAIRTMSKAYYSTENIGHYGLAFPYYTHFTSPIRRYPDLMVHRLLEQYLTGGSVPSTDDYEEYCQHCSAMEKKAADAERASIKYKQAEFLADKIGQEFEAHISGVSKWGIFAEIEGNKCEGLIAIGSLKSDYFMLDEDNYQVIGRRSGKQYKLGDAITIRVKEVDMMKRTIDFELVEDNNPRQSLRSTTKNMPKEKPARTSKQRDKNKKTSSKRGRKEK